MKINYLLLALLLAACSPPPDGVEQLPPAASTYVNQAYSGVPQNYFVGRVNLTGRATAIVRNTSTWACTTTVLGGTDGQLSDEVHVNLGSLGDTFEVVTGPTSVSCTNTLGVVYSLDLSTISSVSSWNMYVYGGSGADYIACNSTWNAAVFCYGNPGNDYMINTVANAPVFMDGGDGNDTMISTAYNANTKVNMSGSYGNDCLSSSVYPAATYDCGIVTLGSVKKSTHVLGANCSAVVASCP